MKLFYTCLAGCILFCSCSKQRISEVPGDRWNGYFDYLKQGEVIHTLWAGKNINVGTVTYGIDDNANFYVTYDCSSSGWLISETHMFAGDKADMPLNKPGSPKVGRFPYSATHNPRVSIYTVSVPLQDLPPAEEPGFVVAAHSVVHSPAGQTETAWAEGEFTFSDKGWGWYDIYFYNQEENTYTVLYGAAWESGSLMIYLLNLTAMTTEMIVSEAVDVPGPFDGAAYDESSGMFFFSSATAGELWVNPIQDEEGSFLAGSLLGTPAGGTFFNGTYLYVDEVTNAIHQVFFDSSWNILSIATLSVIPGAFTVNDIAVDPSGENLYILGLNEAGGTELVLWDMEENEFEVSDVTLDDGAQIAFGGDGNLYAIGFGDPPDSIYIYILETDITLFYPLIDSGIYVEEPFSDLSLGPLM